MKATSENYTDATTVESAVIVLKRGGLVAFPTETVYGLGADAENPAALERLYAVKGRPRQHPVIVHLAASARLEDWAVDIPVAAHRLAEAFWPGPLTLILARGARVPDAVTGGQDTVGLRVPAHPMAQALLEAFGGGVAAPSANRFGRLSPTCAEHVRADLGEDADVILDGGACPVGVESTIVAFREGQPTVLRPGMITPAQLEAVLRQDIPLSGTSGTAGGESDKHQGLNTVSRAPGTLARHYAPRTPLKLLSPEALTQALYGPTPPGLPDRGSGPIGVLARREPPPEHIGTHWIQADSDPAAYARELYAHLRELDQAGLEEIFVEAVPESEDWTAIADRLRRATRD
jgi:L-threonylcarbamoyladenylate synthase